MSFNQAVIDKLSRSKVLQSELSMYNGKLAIFGQWVPKEADLPFIKFYTSSYSVPTINQTIQLSVNYYKADMDTEKAKHIMFEIAETLDNQRLHAPQKDDLRIFVSSNPVYLLGTLDEKSNHASIHFIVRGAIKQWRIL